MKFKIDEPKTGEKITVEILGRQVFEKEIIKMRETRSINCRRYVLL